MARLRRSSPDDPGWSRRRAGSGFVYLDEEGNRLSAEDAERVKGLVIPPAWKDVWICPWPHGHLQAVGTDEAGRRQYLYHPQWRAQRDAAKHARVLDFGRVLSRARERVLMDLGTEGMSRDRACAAAVRLLDLGYFRIGNDVYADQNGSFGLTTLQRRHVRKQGGTMIFCFVGKSGIEHCITIDDVATVEALEVMRRRPQGGGARGDAPPPPRGGGPEAPGVEGARPLARPGRCQRQRLRARDDRHGRDGQGLPHLARHRDRGRLAGVERRARRDQGVAQAGGGGGDEGGRGVPREHPGS